MHPNPKFLVLTVSQQNLNPQVQGPGFADQKTAVEYAKGLTSDPQQRLTVAYIIPVAAAVVEGLEADEQVEKSEDGE